MQTSKLFCLALVSLFLTCASCARVDYVKVPTATQYENWTDAQQAAADNMKGVRYYLPRPYVHLKQSVPVSQRVALVSFVYDSTDKHYKLEMPNDPPTWLLRAAPKQISVTQALAASLMQAKAAEGKGGNDGDGVQEADEDEGQSGDAAPGGEPAPGGPNTATNPPPSVVKSTTGFINQTDPVTALSDKIDVVYLPDFEEQFVIQVRSGLGQATVDTKLRNGWAAEVFSQEVDNSQLIPYIIRQVEKASEAAAGIFTTWMPLGMGLPPGTSPAKLIELLGADGSEESLEATDPDAAAKLLGGVLLFKIAEVRVAQPGLYPILKPREIEEWRKNPIVVSGRDAQETFENFLSAKGTPWIRPDQVFVPAPPFTVIGFNTTTDIFIALATDRVSTGRDPESDKTEKDRIKKEKEELQNAQQVLVDKLNNAITAGKTSATVKANVKTLLTNLKVYTIGPNGDNNTVIRFKNDNNTNLTATQTDADDFEAWLNTALSLGNPANIKVNPVANKAELIANITGTSVIDLSKK